LACSSGFRSEEYGQRFKEQRFVLDFGSGCIMQAAAKFKNVTNAAAVGMLLARRHRPDLLFSPLYYN